MHGKKPKLKQKTVETKAILLHQLAAVTQYAKATKWQRFLKDPIKYLNTIIFKNCIYPITRKSKTVLSSTFFNVTMQLQLPAGIEIYLCKGKAHPAEIRLAQYLIHQLQPADTFVDVGAHYGYFSLLASILVGNKGKVFAFEAAPETFTSLQKNSTTFQQLQVFNQAISNEIAELVFYQFPNLYSEYNSFNIDQYKNTAWFSRNQPKPIKISANTLNQFLTEHNIHPTIIKIDVEGAELQVIEGALPFLKNHRPQLVMEYLSSKRNNATYQAAEKLLRNINYQAHLINQQGKLSQLKNVSNYLDTQNLDTENIVFKKE